MGVSMLTGLVRGGVVQASYLALQGACLRVAGASMAPGLRSSQALPATSPAGGRNNLIPTPQQHNPTNLMSTSSGDGQANCGLVLQGACLCGVGVLISMPG